MIGWFDPRTRVIYYLCFTTVVLLATQIPVLAGLALLGILTLIAARLQWERVRNVLLGAAVFIAIISGLSLVFRTPLEAAQQALRAVAMTTVGLGIVLGFDASQLGITFRKLGLPDRLSFLLDLTMRFVPTLTQDFRITVDAQKARGYELESKDRSLKAMLGAAKRVLPLLVPVMVRSVLDAEDRAHAMDMRAFGTVRRTWLQDLRYRWFDFVLIAVSVAGLAVAIYLRVTGRI
jgi:energy-coupling factor transport system permease protein